MAAGHGGTPTRRHVLGGLAGLALAPTTGMAGPADIHLRPIPGTTARIPAVGMGTWITFNVGEVTALRNQRAEVLRAFFDLGGGMVDSSPMYGSSEAVLGYCLSRLADRGVATSGLIPATKVWTPTGGTAEAQMAESRRLWGVDRLDVLQVHNLVDWPRHLPVLREAKANGDIAYLGVTTSHGRRHGELERILARAPLDFVQLTYNILDREAEQRLLPLAAERGVAVIANRPFRRKGLIHRFADKPLPSWAGEIDCANWPQVLLKFIISHPAVTCTIPATTRVDHMRENMGALRGRLPDAALRRRMAADVEKL